MGFALAHDENGVPLDVPTTASGWLVRKHSGGRGRPAAVYDPDGRPLVVPLDSTVTDLRACGCKTGSYRLDAVDGGRKPMGLTAYTEIVASADEPVEGSGAGGSDAGVAALARAVEAMQRVQAERERVQAEMFMRLIERMAPPPAQPQPTTDMAAMVRNLAEAQEAIREMAEAGSDADEDDAPASSWDSAGSTVDLVVRAGLPLLSQWIWKHMGLSEQQVAQMTTATASASAGTPAPDVPQPAPAKPLERASAEKAKTPTPADVPAAKVPLPAPEAEAADKLGRVFALLTPEEQRKAKMAVQLVPPQVLQQLQTQLLAMEPKAAADLLRKLDRQFGGAVATPTKEAS